MNEIDKTKTESQIAVMQAWVDGSAIQIRARKGGELWSDYAIQFQPQWDWADCDYRIKPLEFPKLPDHLQWHNPNNLTPEQVGEGFRLICTLEADKTKPLLQGIEYFIGSGWRKSAFQHGREETYRVPSSTPFPEPPKPKVMVPLEMKDLPPVFWVRGNFEQWLCTGRDKENNKILFKEEWKALVICKMEGWEMSVNPRDDESWRAMEKESAS